MRDGTAPGACGERELQGEGGSLGDAGGRPGSRGEGGVPGDPRDEIAERGRPGHSPAAPARKLRTVLPSRSGWGRKGDEPRSEVPGVRAASARPPLYLS